MGFDGVWENRIFEVGCTAKSNFHTKIYSLYGQVVRHLTSNEEIVSSNLAEGIRAGAHLTPDLKGAWTLVRGEPREKTEKVNSEGRK